MFTKNSVTNLLFLTSNTDSIRSTSGSSRIPSRIQFCWKQMVDTDWETPVVVRKKVIENLFTNLCIYTVPNTSVRKCANTRKPPCKYLDDLQGKYWG
jgi:hypothetical protein